MSIVPLHNDVLGHTQLWFDKARPNVTSKDLYTQLGAHFEEVGEMIDAIVPMDIDTHHLLGEAHKALQALSNHFYKDPDAKINIEKTRSVDLLDALCDQVVTGTGVAHHFGFPMVEAMVEVNASNFSKFDDQGNAIKNENGKIMKGPNYRKPDLVAVLSAKQPDLFDCLNG